MKNTPEQLIHKLREADKKLESVVYRIFDIQSTIRLLIGSIERGHDGEKYEQRINSVLGKAKKYIFDHN